MTFLLLSFRICCFQDIDGIALKQIRLFIHADCMERGNKRSFRSAAFILALYLLPASVASLSLPPSSFGCQRLISLSHGESKMPEREAAGDNIEEIFLGAASIKFTPNKGYDISPTLATLMRAKARVKFCQRRSGSYSGFGKLS